MTLPLTREHLDSTFARWGHRPGRLGRLTLSIKGRVNPRSYAAYTYNPSVDLSETVVYVIGAVPKHHRCAWHLLGLPGEEVAARYIDKSPSGADWYVAGWGEREHPDHAPWGPYFLLHRWPDGTRGIDYGDEKLNKRTDRMEGYARLVGSFRPATGSEASGV